MSQTKSYFILLACVFAILSLYLPYWFAAFILAGISGLLFKLKLSYKLMALFLIYAVVTVCYCLWSIQYGSSALVHMISVLFKNVSTLVLISMSAVLNAITAVLGGWCGSVLGNLFRKQ